MIVFIDDILNGNIQSLLGDDLYASTISNVVIWWSVLPMFGIIAVFCFLIASLFGGNRK